MPTNHDRAPDFTEPSGPPSRRRHWRRQRVTGVAALTGLGAVTAAAGLVAGLLIVRSGPAAPAQTAATRTTRTPAHPSATTPAAGPLPGNRLDQVTTPATSAAAANAGLPAYYVAASQLGTTALTVRSSATGKIVSTVAAPAGCMQGAYQVSAGGDDRNFVFSCLLWSTRKNRFFRVQLSSQGVPTVTSLPVPLVASTFVTGLALTPDGRTLALGLQRGAGAVIEVVTLATGAHRAWNGPRMDRPTLLNWIDHDREIGFWSQGLRALDVTAAGPNLASAPLVLSIFHKSELVQAAMLSPDGTTIIADVSYILPRGRRPTPATVIGGIAEVAAGSGKTMRLFVPQHLKGNADYPCQVAAIDASGHHILAGCDQFDRIDRGRVTALAGPDIQMGFTGGW